MKTKHSISALFLAFFVLTLFTSCNGDSVDTVKAIESNYENHDKTIELIGEFDAPSFTFSSGKSKTMAMNFVVKSHAFSSEKFTAFSVILPVGTGKNNVLFNVPADQKNYTLKNFDVFDDNGEKINLDSHTTFKMKGKVHYSEMEKPENEREKDNFSYKITDVSFVKD
ncbi:hypothetical protein ACLCDV_05745 [Sphingobacterium sp. Lzh-3]|jgi:hypothetical protein|uniref:hypothetical protein n=1 Tax=Sphingobacterium TaxID=28453 RepID=UPI0029533B6B|nr:hypothetical protein [Sphingobacterium sp. UGAL515B_05]WON95192.1 hypothetical protein OK025_01960 [Sphingobacterium sp. UGAL515B_05]